MPQGLPLIDLLILIAYGSAVIGIGIYHSRKVSTANQFMIAGQTIPAWAAGLSVMSTYISSISFIAVPGKAYDTDWHQFIFALCIPPVAWFAGKYAIPYYRKMKLISVYEFLEIKLGVWGRILASWAFMLFSIGRVAVILYLVGLLMNTLVQWNILYVIVIVGALTIAYTLLGGMEAVIWTEVMQGFIMIAGVALCAILLSYQIFSKPEFLVQTAIDAHKFSFGSLDFSFAPRASRTVWVMIIYGVTENLRNLFADQNYIQKYSTCPDEAQARRSVWIGVWTYIPMTAFFIFIGTALFAFYSSRSHPLPAEITKGDQVFPYFIAHQLPVGIRGLIIAAILAAAMSTVDSALNCSATVLLVYFYKRYLNPQISEKGSVLFLRLIVVLWGIFGSAVAILMMKAKSALDIWWQISGIFGGMLLSLFILAMLKIKVKVWQGIVAITVSSAAILWGALADWPKKNIEGILVGAFGTVVFLIVAVILGWANKLISKETQNT